MPSIKQVVKTEKCYKLRLTTAQVAAIRAAVRGYDGAPIKYAGAVLLAQGGGWYHISPERESFDFASDEQLMKGMLRKIISILAPKDETVEVGKGPEVTLPTYVGGGVPHREMATMHATEGGGKSLMAKAAADADRLKALANRLNNKFHRG